MVVGCQNRGGKGAARIARLNTRVPAGSGDGLLSSRLSYRPPHRGWYPCGTISFPLLRALPLPRVPCGFRGCPFGGSPLSRAAAMVTHHPSSRCCRSSVAGVLCPPPGVGDRTDVALLCLLPPPLAADERMREAELSACCTAACSTSVCSSRRRLRPSRVAGSGMARSRAAAVMSF